MIQPYYETELGILYHGDCLEILPHLKKVDFILSDYPFNCQDGRKNYEDFVRQTAELYDAISNEVCNLFIINNPAKIFTTSQYFQNWKLINGVALIRRGSLRPAWHFGFQHNYGLVLNKGGIKEKWNGTRKNHDKNFFTDVIKYQNGYRGSAGSWHPQAIPLKLADSVIRILSHEGDLVLDPFLGSGTTAVICERLRRRWIGIEFNKEYCDIAVRRIEQEINQLNLFTNLHRLNKW